MNSLFLLVLTIFICLKANLSMIISINSSQSLVEALQKNFWSAHNTTVVIDSSKRYTLPPGKFFNVWNISIKIISNRGLVNIYCDSQFGYIHSTAGISFFNSNVTIERISFKNCGANLTTLPFDLINTFNDSSLLYYTNTHAAALLFIQCTVDMTEVVLNRSYGFAIVGLNIRNSLFQNFHCSNSMNFVHSRAIGTGMLLHFTDTPGPLAAHKTTISIFNAFFNNNYDMLSHSDCIYNILNNVHNNSRYPVPNAAGLTILYTQMNYMACVEINKGRFSNNICEVTGAMLIANFQTNIFDTSRTSINNSLFEKNAQFLKKMCRGVALQFYFFGTSNKSYPSTYSPLSLENTIFKNHHDGRWKRNHYHTTGSIYIDISTNRAQVSLIFINLHCHHNTIPLVGGTCATVATLRHFGEGSKVNLVMKDILAYNNSNLAYYDTPRTIFHFLSILNVSIDGTSNFTNNFGSVIFALESNVYLQGQLYFRNNTGGNGGAIWIEGSCPLYFMNGLKASFINNRAYLAGGAIYAHVNSYTQCALQIANCHNIKISFYNNLAKTAGNSIFATPLFSCQKNPGFQLHWYYTCFNLTNKNSLNQKNHLLPLSTDPHSFNVHFDVKTWSSCLEKFAGEKIELTITAYDNEYQKLHVYALINVEVHSKNYIETNQKLWLTQSGGDRVLEGIPNTSMTLSVHTNILQQVDAFLVFTVSRILIRTYSMRILSCPLGFDLKTSSGSCECSELLDSLGDTQCFIDNRRITRKSIISSWIGGIENNTKLALSKSCPNVYCNSDPYYKYINNTDDGMVLSSEDGETTPLCLQNRVGILCGQCSQEYSVVFGTNECKKCSNWWLFTILMYAFAGPILIYLLYSLRLTLTNGTLNGIIFYAQVANTGLLNLMTRMTLLYNNSELIKRSCLSLSVILSILNLNIGFPLCFYNGMDQVWKTGLSLIFPVYLLTIVVVIITVSRHSSWLSNHTSHSSVQVLVTVVHLSFSKLSLAFIDVFTSSTIQTSSGSYQVWYWDGSVEYMKYPHYVLVIITIVIALLLIIPYITLLLLAKPLIQYSRPANFYLRPIYEAIHAPFKEGREFWFVGRLMLLIFIYIMYVVERNMNSIIFSLTISSLLTSFLIGQTLFRPFKHKLMNILDCWLMFNITLVYVSMWDKAVVTTTVFSLVSVILAILTFGVIILYHILLVTNCLKKIIGSINRASSFIYGKMEPFIPQKITRNKEVQLTNTDSYYHTFEGYREPLLSK